MAFLPLPVKKLLTYDIAWFKPCYDVAAIKVPSDYEQIEQFKVAINLRNPLLKDVWCTMDGLKLLLEKSGNEEIQNDFYNVWTCDHHVSGVFTFCPDGTIPTISFNVPGVKKSLVFLTFVAPVATLLVCLNL